MAKPDCTQEASETMDSAIEEYTADSIVDVGSILNISCPYRNKSLNYKYWPTKIKFYAFFPPDAPTLPSVHSETAFQIIEN